MRIHIHTYTHTHIHTSYCSVVPLTHTTPLDSCSNAAGIGSDKVPPSKAPPGPPNPKTKRAPSFSAFYGGSIPKGGTGLGNKTSSTGGLHRSCTLVPAACDEHDALRIRVAQAHESLTSACYMHCCARHIESEGRARMAVVDSYESEVGTCRHLDHPKHLHCRAVLYKFERLTPCVCISR